MLLCDPAISVLGGMRSALHAAELLLLPPLLHLLLLSSCFLTLPSLPAFHACSAAILHITEGQMCCICSCIFAVLELL
jgi:hypothetical protein